jgi:HlyD family secretion protein
VVNTAARRQRGLSMRFASGLCAAALLTFAPSGAAYAQAADATAPTVTLARAANACFTDLVFFTGTLVPREEILVFPEAEGGRISEILVEEGDLVRADQALARLTRTGAGRSQTSEVTAPAEGMIIRRSARVGAIASAASPEPLFRIARGGEVEVEADIPEVRLSKVAVGQPVRVQIPGTGEVSGRVRLVAPEIDRQTRLGRVRISLTDSRLRFGRTVSGAIETGRSCGIAVPVSALVTRGEDTYVQRVRNGQVDTTPVRLGLVDAGRVEVRQGLAEGDIVVARAGAFLRNGDAVRGVMQGELGPASELRR